MVFGLEMGAYIAIATLGFTIIYGVVNMLNFAYGEYITIGAFVGYYVVELTPLTYFVALPAVIILTMLLGWAVSRLFFVPIHDSGPIPLLLTSIGVGYILRHVMRLAFGDRSRFIDLESSTYSIETLDLFVSTRHVLVIGISLFTFVAIHVLLTRTDAGIAMRATSENEKLSVINGIYTDKIRRNVWLLSSALAGLAGYMIATATHVNTLVGFHQILIIIAAAILGGIGSAYGAFAGAYIIGLVIVLSGAYLPSEFAGLGQAMAFGVLILVLLVRPSGIANVEVNS